MVIASARRALDRLWTAEFRSVLWQSVGFTLAALVALWLALRWLVGAVGIPWLESLMGGALGAWIGAWSGTFGVVAAIGASLVLAVLVAFLFAPVTVLVAGLFLDDAAEVIEREDYPGDAPGHALPLMESLAHTGRFFGVVIAANLVALALLLVPGINAAAFFLANGYVLGREYFEFAAMRHMPAAEAKALRQTHAGSVFLAGLLIAVWLVIPVLNLLAPLFAAAMMVHLAKAAREAQPG
jgi:CysZ protein